MEGESFNSVSLMTMVLSFPPEAPFVVVGAAEEEEPYFSPPPEDPPVVDLPELVALSLLESPLQAEDSPSPTAAAAYEHNREHKRESPNRKCAFQCTAHRP